MMSERYEKARAIAEAAANRWDQFSDTAGVGWLADQIHQAIAAEAPPNDGDLCQCNIGQCHFLTERCREMAS